MPIIKNFYPHKVSGRADDSFVGLKIIGNSIHFFYPEAYRFSIEADTVRNDIIDLLRTISIAKTSSSLVSQAFNETKTHGEFALLSYLWVINDYLANGFYNNREKTFRNNQSGRVNWKKTLQNQPIVSNGNIIYNDIVVEVKNSVDNLLVDIHKYCVKKSIDYIGWLFNLSSAHITVKPFNEHIKKIYIDALHKELDKTFDDVKCLRLRHLLNIVIGLDANDNSDRFVYGVDSYYYIFERMIDSIFGGIKDLKDFYPKATWHLIRNGLAATPSSELRPDTIVVREGNVFILDSKYYRFGYTGKESDLPETTSIQKQITYGDYILKNITKTRVNRVFNAFLMPYDKTRDVFLSNDDIQYIGYAKSTWKDNEKAHEIIHAFLIDLYHVIKTWNRYSHENDVDFLINTILSKQSLS